MTKHFRLISLCSLTLLGGGTNLWLYTQKNEPIESVNNPHIQKTSYSTTVAPSNSPLDLPTLVEESNRSVLKVQFKVGKKVDFGTAFVIKNGYILTNAHVAQNGNVQFYNQEGVEVKARFFGSDRTADVALFLLDDPTAIPAIPFGDSNQLRVGEPVVAIGMPMKQDFSATSGIVSGKGRSIDPQNKQLKFIQTDAAINPGNSGGPLLNQQGSVIGINTAMVSDGQNIGFALPIESAVSSARRLLDNYSQR